MFQVSGASEDTIGWPKYSRQLLQNSYCAPSANSRRAVLISMDAVERSRIDMDEHDRVSIMVYIGV